MDTDFDRKLEPGVETGVDVSRAGWVLILSWQLALLHHGKVGLHAGFQPPCGVIPLKT